MNYYTKAILLIGIFSVSISAHGQLGGLKKGLKKVKKKTEEKAEPETNIKKEETSSSNEVSLSDLEDEKMEWNSFFQRLEKKWDNIPYTEYSAKKDEYNEFYKSYSRAYKVDRKKEHEDDYTQKLISTVDGYYTDKVPESKMATMKETVKRSFDKEDWTVYPSDRIEDIETGRKQVNNARVYLKKPDPELEEFDHTLVKQKEKIIKYVEEGGLEKREAEIEKRMVEKRRLHNAGMTDASVVSTAKSKLDQERYGKPLKVVITSNEWQYERTKYGQTKLKYVKVDIATKKSDGKCYYVRGSVAQQHEGGGVYGNKYLNIYYTEGEMKCSNVD